MSGTLAYPSWTDLFYSNDIIPIPVLTSSNWAHWSTSVMNLLRPYDCVVEILQGNVAPSSDQYTHMINVELFVFLTKCLPREYKSIAMDARGRYGMAGSELYRVLKARMDVVREAAASDSQVTSVTISSTSSKRKGAEVMLLKSLKIEPLRNSHGWPWLTWNEKLQDALKPYESAVEILTGVIQEDHWNYDISLDSDLFYIVQQVVTGEYDTIVAETVAKHGCKGSKLYAIIKRHVQTERRSHLDRSNFRFGPNPSLESALNGLYVQIHLLQQLDVAITEKEVSQYVEKVGSIYSKKERSRLLTSKRCSNLQEYFATLHFLEKKGV